MQDRSHHLHPGEWKVDYRRLTEVLFERTRVEMITLGQPRFRPSLLNLVRNRHPGAGQVLSNLPPWHGMEKSAGGDSGERIEVYRQLLSIIDEYGRGNGPLMMVCKEDEDTVRALKFGTPRCHCLA